MTVGAALAGAVRLVGVHRWTWLRTALVLQVLAALLAGPAIAFLLRAALGVAGVAALTEASIGQVVRHPVAVLLLLGLATVATLAVLVQHAAFVLLARDLASGRVPTLRGLAREGLAAARRLAGPQLPLVAVYSFVLVPLGGFTLGASLTRGIELPPFIAGELQKTPLGTAAWLVGVLVVLLLNLRLVVVPTLLLTTPLPPAAAFSVSWRVTRGIVGHLVLAALAAGFAAAVLGAGSVTAGVALTRVSDAVWPAASPWVAAMALTGVQVLLILFQAGVAAFASVALVALTAPVRSAEPPTPPGPRPLPHGRPLPRAAVPATIAVVVLAVVANEAALAGAGSGTRTAVVAHRGATYGAVENTLESLEAAAALGADLVELDVLQAADGGLVVVHDTNLRRIAGVNRNVWEMTTAELMATTVRQGGREALLPAFDTFARRAAELGVPLLVELKAHGHETGDLVGDVVAVLEEHGLVEGSLVQAFDRETVAEIESRFPEVTTGWVVAFSRGRLDPGAADFVTIEQTSYSPAVLQDAHAAGVGVYLWTVTDPVRMRAFVRDGVDGLITGYPSRALEQREAVADETGMAGRLEDTLRALLDW